MKTIILMLCSLILTACANMPLDTLNKRIAAFELTYEQALTTLGLWIKENRLSADNKAKAQQLVKQISEARAAIYIAKGLKDLSKAQNQLNVANASLKILRDILAAKEKQSAIILEPMRALL